MSVFAVTFSGSATHWTWNNPVVGHVGFWTETVDRASGSVDFYTNTISDWDFLYQCRYLYGKNAPGSWDFSCNESDSLSVYINGHGPLTTKSESGYDWGTNIENIVVP
jgi:hypothetical protein